MSDIVERIRSSRFVHVPGTSQLMEEAAAEITRLREAIRRLAEQDATLSVHGGSVTVTLDATLTDEEREAIENAITLRLCDAKWEEDRNGMADNARARKAKRECETLLKLLERLK